MARKIKYRVGDIVYFLKNKMTSKVTAMRTYGVYIKQTNGSSLCLKPDEILPATNEQKRAYFIEQSRLKANTKVVEDNKVRYDFRAFKGGTKATVKHKVTPTGIQIKLLKEILVFLNIKAESFSKLKTTQTYHPLSAVWHQPGDFDEAGKPGRIKYGYGWVIISDWMNLMDNSSFTAFIKVFQIKYKKQGLIFDFVFYLHNKVQYSGLISIRPLKQDKIWRLPNEKQADGH